MAYVGYSRSLASRVEQQIGIIKAGKEARRLPKRQCQSRHYQNALRADGSDSRSSFKALATIDDNIPTKYFILFESIFMILFKTVRYPGYTTSFSPIECYESMDEFSSSLEIRSSLFGLNMNLSVYQRIPHDWAHLVLACTNPACPQMTYPGWHPARPKSKRHLFDSSDPGQGYLCGPCGSFRQRTGKLRDEKDIERHNRKGKEHAAIYNSCEVCDRLYSQFMAPRCYAGGKWCCTTCSSFWSVKKRHRNEEELGKLLEHDQRRAPPSLCENCNGKLPVQQRVFIGDKWCCQACEHFFRRNKTHRGQAQFEQCAEKQQRRKCPNVCEVKHCGAEIEKGYYIDEEWCCAECHQFYSKNKRHRTEKEFGDLQDKRQKHDFRRQARPSACQICPDSLEEKHYYVENTFICKGCHDFYKRTKRFRTPEEVENLLAKRRRPEWPGTCQVCHVKLESRKRSIFVNNEKWCCPSEWAFFKKNKRLRTDLEDEKLLRNRSE